MSKELADQVRAWQETHNHTIFLPHEEHRPVGGVPKKQDRAGHQIHFHMQREGSKVNRIVLGLNYGQREIYNQGLFCHTAWFDRVVAYNLKQGNKKIELPIPEEYQFISFTQRFYNDRHMLLAMDAKGDVFPFYIRWSSENVKDIAMAPAEAS